MMIQRWCIVSYKTRTQRDKSIAASDLYAQAGPYWGREEHPHTPNCPDIGAGNPLTLINKVQYSGPSF